jgi:hypothetical protein
MTSILHIRTVGEGESYALNAFLRVRQHYVSARDQGASASEEK